jgi:major membrane immunogen (membrane-anchored lipoprotein)
MRNFKLLIVVLILSAISYGCKQAGLSDYSTPEGTYKTYLKQAKTLRVVADHRYYRRAIRCFTEENRDWFEE